MSKHKRKPRRSDKEQRCETAIAALNLAAALVGLVLKIIEIIDKLLEKLS